MNAEVRYTVINDMFEGMETMSLEFLKAMAPEWNTAAWEFAAKGHLNELRLYCHRRHDPDLVCDEDEGIDEEYQPTPSRHADWRMIDSDYGYLVVGRISEDQP